MTADHARYCLGVRGRPYTADQCRLCWVRRYGPEPVPPPVELVTARAAPPCAHEGHTAPAPAGLNPRKTYLRCDKGMGTGGVVCRCDCNSRCKGYEPDTPDEPDPAPARRHVACHVLPVPNNGVWRRSLDQLKLRWRLFTGRKVFAVCTGSFRGHPLDSPDDVRDYLPPGAEVVEVPNDPGLREVATWQPLWDRVLDGANPQDCALYCHTKGATRRVDPGNSCQWWASLCWSLSLDHWGLIEKKLARRPVVGPFKKLGYGFGHGYGRFHYSGTFFWVKVGDFRKRLAVPVPRQWWGVEAWPGLAYDVAEAEELFLSGQVPAHDLYAPRYWGETVRPEYGRWIQQNRPSWPWLNPAPTR
jgi:hypothetical protein